MASPHAARSKALLARKRWLRGQSSDESALRRNLLNNYLRCKFKVLHGRLDPYYLDEFALLNNPAWAAVKQDFDAWLYEVPPDEYNDVAKHLNKRLKGAKLLVTDWYTGDKNDD